LATAVDALPTGGIGGALIVPGGSGGAESRVILLTRTRQDWRSFGLMLCHWLTFTRNFARSSEGSSANFLNPSKHRSRLSLGNRSNDRKLSSICCRSAS